MTPDSPALQEWIDATANWFGVEAQLVESTYDAVDQMIRCAGPAIIQLPTNNGARFLALLRGSKTAISLLCPNLEVTAIKPDVIRTALLEPIEAPFEREIQALIEAAGVPPRRERRARDAAMRERLRGRLVASCWMLRLPARASFWRQLCRANLHRRALLLVLAFAVEYVLWILSWWLIGLAALDGRLDRGWLLAWALLLLTIVPFRLLGTCSRAYFPSELQPC
jgi:ATP-binding cassette subfamily B protein